MCSDPLVLNLDDYNGSFSQCEYTGVSFLLPSFKGTKPKCGHIVGQEHHKWIAGLIVSIS